MLALRLKEEQAEQEVDMIDTINIIVGFVSLVSKTPSNGSIMMII